MNGHRDKLRAYLRANTTEKSTSTEPRIHNIMADGGNSRAGVRRTFHSFNAYPAKRHCKKAAGKCSSAAKLGPELETLESKELVHGVNI